MALMEKTKAIKKQVHMSCAILCCDVCCNMDDMVQYKSIVEHGENESTVVLEDMREDVM